MGQTCTVCDRELSGGNVCDCGTTLAYDCPACKSTTSLPTIFVTKKVEAESKWLSPFIRKHVCQACGSGLKLPEGPGPRERAKRRVCKDYGCNTILSMYNSSDFCFLHMEERLLYKVCPCGELLEVGNPGPLCLEHSRCSKCGAKTLGGDICDHCLPPSPGRLLVGAGQINPLRIAQDVESLSEFISEATVALAERPEDRPWLWGRLDVATKTMRHLEMKGKMPK